MATTLLAKAAWKEMLVDAHCLCEWDDLSALDQGRFTDWLERIVAEKDAEIARLRSVNSELEVARLKADLATARRAKPEPTPRRTGGQKLHDSMRERVDWRPWRDCGEQHHADMEAVAKEHGIPDDPEPPSDGELLEKAHDEAATNAEWGTVAAEFLKLRAERDGGAT